MYFPTSYLARGGVWVITRFRRPRTLLSLGILLQSRKNKIVELTRKDDSSVAYTKTRAQKDTKATRGASDMSWWVGGGEFRGYECYSEPPRIPYPLFGRRPLPSHPIPYVPVVYKNFRVHPHWCQNKCVSRLAFMLLYHVPLGTTSAFPSNHPRVAQKFSTPS